MRQEHEESAVIAETENGRLRGRSVRGVNVFRGIPYGGPTNGAGRFLPPPKPAKWVGVRDATVTGPRCVQPPGNIFLDPRIGEYFAGGRADRITLAEQVDDESCLVLNVLTPGLQGRRPVMVYVHGGGFTFGSGLLSLYSDAFVREQDVVLVGVNHRLGVFGYTYLGELSERYSIGNVGQLDLIAALEWVRDNVDRFGGDPGNVTLFGESGGGAKINTLMAMPAAMGLFHRAIVESGSMLRAASQEQGTAAARALLGVLGLSEGQVDQLQSVPAAALLAAGLESARGELAVALRFGPVIDGRSLPFQTWDPRAPETSADIPLIVGNCKDESTLFQLDDSAIFSLDDAGLRRRLVDDGLPGEVVDPLLAAYRRDHPSDSATALFFRLSTDRGARWNAVRQAELKVEQGRADVYVYYFAWDTPLVDGRIKAFHTAELPLAMRLVRYPESERLSRQIAGAWASFARSGRPAHPELPDWPAYDLSRRSTMILDAAGCQAVDDPDREERLLLRDRPSKRLL